MVDGDEYRDLAALHRETGGLSVPHIVLMASGMIVPS
jgi:hypothetical protein